MRIYQSKTAAADIAWSKASPLALFVTLAASSSLSGVLGAPASDNGVQVANDHDGPRSHTHVPGSHSHHGTHTRSHDPASTHAHQGAHTHDPANAQSHDARDILGTLLGSPAAHAHHRHQPANTHDHSSPSQDHANQLHGHDTRQLLAPLNSLLSGLLASLQNLLNGPDLDGATSAVLSTALSGLQAAHPELAALGSTVSTIPVVGGLVPTTPALSEAPLVALPAAIPNVSPANVTSIVPTLPVNASTIPALPVPVPSVPVALPVPVPSTPVQHPAVVPPATYLE